MSSLIKTPLVNHVLSLFLNPQNPFETVLEGIEQEVIQLLMVLEAVKKDSNDNNALKILTNLYQETKNSITVQHYIKNPHSFSSTELSILSIVFDSLDKDRGLNQFNVYVSNITNEEKTVFFGNDDELELYKEEIPKLMDKVGFSFTPIKQRYCYCHQHILLACIQQKKLLDFLDRAREINHKKIINQAINNLGKDIERYYGDTLKEITDLLVSNDVSHDKQDSLKKALFSLAKKNPHLLKRLEEKLDQEYAEHTIQKTDDIRKILNQNMEERRSNILMRSSTTIEKWNLKHLFSNSEEEMDTIQLSIPKITIEKELKLQNYDEVIYNICNEITKQLRVNKNTNMLMQYTDSIQSKLTALDQYKYWFEMSTCKLSNKINTVIAKRGLALFPELELIKNNKKTTVLKASKSLKSKSDRFGEALTIKQSYEKTNSFIKNELLSLIETQIDYRIKAPYPFKKYTLTPLTYGLENRHLSFLTVISKLIKTNNLSMPYKKLKELTSVLEKALADNPKLNRHDLIRLFELDDETNTYQNEFDIDVFADNFTRELDKAIKKYKGN